MAQRREWQEEAATHKISLQEESAVTRDALRPIQSKLEDLDGQVTPTFPHRSAHNLEEAIKIMQVIGI